MSFYILQISYNIHRLLFATLHQVTPYYFLGKLHFPLYISETPFLIKTSINLSHASLSTKVVVYRFLFLFFL